MRFRDWPSTLRPASYRGAKFFVERDQIETGRRLEVHEFPHRDVPYVEDLGRKANKIDVTAYVLGDSADRQEQALRKACEQGGAATLSLPIERLSAHCDSCKRDFSKDQLGYIAFALSFVREGTQSAGPYPAAYHARVAATGAGKVRRALKGFAGRRLRTIRRAGIVRDALKREIEALAAAIDATRAALPLDAAAAPGLADDVQSLYDEAAALAVVGEAGDRWTATQFVSAAASADAEVVDRTTALLEALREAAEPAAVVRHYTGLTAYAVEVPPAAGTPSRRQIAANAAALASVVRVAALSEWAVAVAESDYTDRRAAIQARADLAERFAAELDRLSGPDAYEVSLALVEVRDAAVATLSRAITDLAPVMVVESARRMPSLWWAHRLYGDASRADGLARRNRVVHAGFMPLEIEALAR